MYIGHHPNVTAINSSIQQAVTIISSQIARECQGRELMATPADLEPEHCSAQAARRHRSNVFLLLQGLRTLLKELNVYALIVLRVARQFGVFRNVLLCYVVGV
jgi:hypothetical protein